MLISWTARRTNKSLLMKVYNTTTSNNIEITTSYFGRIIWKQNSLRKSVMWRMGDDTKDRLTTGTKCILECTVIEIIEEQLLSDNLDDKEHEIAVSIVQ